MGSTRKSKKSCNHSQEQAPASSPKFQHLISLLQAPGDVRVPALKSLYRLLVQLSLNSQQCPRYTLDLHERFKAPSKDIETLSGILFDEMYKRFDHLFSAPRDDSANDLRQGNMLWNKSEDAETSYLLLRCCMVTLTFPMSRPNLLEKSKVVFVLLRKLCSINTAGASLRLFEPSDLHASSLYATFEVFVDELLVHGQLREYFKNIDSQASSSEMIFLRQSGQGDIKIIMEILSRYFLISWFDERRSGVHLNRILSVNNEHFKFSFKTQELSLAAATSLLLNPVILSAPKLMQAHLISMVYEATFILVDMKNLRTNHRPINFFLSLFEKSVALYMKHVALLQTSCQSSFVNHSSTKNAEEKYIHPHFELCILASTREDINNLILKLEDSSQSHFHKLFFEKKSDLMNSTMTYVNQSRYLLDKSCQDEIMSTLSCLITRASDSFEDNAIVDVSLQDICLLVSILKLVSSSLLQVVWCLRCDVSSDCPKTLKDFSSCREYDSILGIINCFTEPNVESSVRKLLHQMTEIDSVKHKVSKMMFLHFVGLLSFSFFKRLDCLAKGCLFTIIALLNLFIFEEGNLDILQSLVNRTPDSFSTEFSGVRTRKAVADMRSTVAVASKFQKARTLCSRGREDNTKNALHNKDDVEVMEEETEKTVDGKIFLKCRLACGEQVPDFNDLADFIECKKGKDYSSWVKHRQQYRNSKFEKMEQLKWERKKKSWKRMKRKRKA